MDVELSSVSISAESANWLAEFARGLVEARLAACGNIYPQVRSVYQWEGAMEDAAEAVVILHTRRSLVPAIIERADADHPYDTPQVLAVPIVGVHPGYRDWVLASTTEG